MKGGIPEQDRTGLREFGLAVGSMVAVLFGAVLPWLFDLSYPVWPWVAGGALMAWALAAPGSLRPVYWLWMRFGLLLGRFTTPILMGIVYFMVITPMAALGRLFRKDPMARRFDAGASSYRVASRKSSKEKMEKPY